MSSYWSNPIVGRSVALGALALILATGCWEEVHYTGSTPPAARSGSNTRSVPAVVQDVKSAGGFGDDLAAKLSQTPPVAAPSRDVFQAPDPSARDLPATQSLPQRTEPVSEPREPTTQPDPRDSVDKPVDKPNEQPASAAAALPIAEPPPARVDVTTAVPAVELPAEKSPPQAAVQLASSNAVSTAKTRRAAWLLGSKWSLAALGRDHGASPENVEAWLSQSQALARLLGMTLAELPPRSNDRGASSQPVVKYLHDEGQRVGRELAMRHGRDHAALFEVAVKSNLLVILYEPGAADGIAISEAIRQASLPTGLTADLFLPVLKAIADRAPKEETQRAVFRLHEDVDKALARAALK